MQAKTAKITTATAKQTAGSWARGGTDDRRVGDNCVTALLGNTRLFRAIGKRE